MKRAVLVTFDSLNRHWLSPYGGTRVGTPNFGRLAARSAVFDRAYVASMPCMPARRELHTGRYNFLHTEWGCLEPYDVSTPGILRGAGVHTHHCTDHQHYWEDGGHHYMQRYSSHEMFRGQEGDRWKDAPGPVGVPPLMAGKAPDAGNLRDQRNRQQWLQPEDWPMAQTDSAGLDYLRKAVATDRSWFLHIETFDPHEPFCAPETYRRRFPKQVPERRCDWPPYGRYAGHGVSETELADCQSEYDALVAFCDDQLGRVLDAFDRFDLWEDTMLIVHTDHGFFLGERNYTGKCHMPFYNEVANIPFFVHDPRHPEAAGTRRRGLVQMIDLCPTLLSYFGLEVPDSVRGRNLESCVSDDAPGHDCILFGLHGGLLHVLRDDNWMCKFPPDSSTPLYNHTLCFSHMRDFAPLAALRELEPDREYDFTRGLRLMRYPAKSWPGEPGDPAVFDLNRDPKQMHPVPDPAKMEALLRAARAVFDRHDAPDDTRARYG